MRYYLTTAIPYVNAKPHLGFVLEIVQADAYARFLRSQGEEVYFITGTDENSLKNVISAKKKGITPQMLVDKNSQAFKNLKDLFNLSYNDFIRTTELRHREGVAKFWKKISSRGDIYKKKYKGLYCVGSESFVRPEDLVDGLCPEHKEKPELVEEENYFFALSHYQKEIEQLFASPKFDIYPSRRKNELLTFIKQGLEDFSISRSRERAGNWGISVPNDPSQVIYVWVDALSNYITALNYREEKSALFQKWWEQSDKIIHFIGKGITRFHAIYWPGLLLSAHLRLPTTIFVHGYLTINGEKISKSSGVTIDPFDITQQYDPEVIRYFLLREFSPVEDGDFSIRRLQERYLSDLSRGVGNLLSRVLALGEQSGEDISLAKISSSWKQSVEKIYQQYQQEMKGFHFNNALAKMNELSSLSDRYISQEKPWACKDREKFQTTIANLIYSLAYITLMLSPAMPQAAEKMLSFLQLEEITPSSWREKSIRLRKKPPLFPKK